MSTEQKTRIVLFDIDGVLANDNHRVEHALAQRWADYFAPETVNLDGVWEQGRQALQREKDAGSEIGYLTGRREDLRPVTRNWLYANDFPMMPVLMRPFDVTVPLANLKADLIEKIRVENPGAEVVLYDDDPEVIRLVQERFGEDAGVHCTWHVKQKALIKEAVA